MQITFRYRADHFGYFRVKTKCIWKVTTDQVTTMIAQLSNYLSYGWDESAWHHSTWEIYLFTIDICHNLLNCNCFFYGWNSKINSPSTRQDRAVNDMVIINLTYFNEDNEMASFFSFIFHWFLKGHFVLYFLDLAPICYIGVSYIWSKSYIELRCVINCFGTGVLCRVGWCYSRFSAKLLNSFGCTSCWFQYSIHFDHTVYVCIVCTVYCILYCMYCTCILCI